MAQITITLFTGLKVGEEMLKDVTMRDVTAGDIIEANEESEKAVITTDGPQLVMSPTLVGLNVLRRQIVSIGNIKGPISISELKKLTPHDLNQLQVQADAMDDAVAAEIIGKEMTKRGRAEGAAE
ncbi:MAG: phage tail assembly protein [Proteobacteria bacterium]|nr:phage tail assembly protein [Pseudomonadota bacterium]